MKDDRYRRRSCVTCGKKFTNADMRVQWCGYHCSPHTHGRRFIIFKRDEFTCIYCGASDPGGKRLHLDHVYPHSEGGSDKASNLVTACGRCNISKGNKILDYDKQTEVYDVIRQRNLEHSLDSNLIITIRGQFTL